MTPDIVVVPHTHWDREWYLPFQRFRLGLVRMLDEVLDTMAADPGYRFTMDGQLAALEDYLEIRPERLPAVRRLVAEGRFAAGPWLILADEFLCSGETLIRNLEYGMRGAAELGGVMRVGYLPDQFGHCAQMPQILRQAGLEHACLWRGVPASVDRDAFAWIGADGTAVRTQYLPGGYGNAVALFSGPPQALADRLAAFTETLRPWHPAGPLLAMYGADHSAPAADITAAGLRIATLHDYVTAQDPSVTDLPAVHGELRSHARANILPGVISARIPAKQAMARAERVVTRYAEPLSALWLPGGTAAAKLLDMAWRRLIACSGHDSITGCGADETAQQVAARIAEAEQIGQAVVDMVSASLSDRASRDALVVVNPSPFPRTALVLADLPESRAALSAPDGGRVPSQRLELAPTLLDETVMDDLTQLLGRIHERELFGQEIVSWSADGDVFTIVVGRHATTGYDYADLRAAVLDGAAARPGPWRVRTCAEPVVTVAAHVTVAPFGRTVLTSVPAPAPAQVPDGPGWARPAEGTLDNGLLRVTVAPDGTLSLFADGAEAHGVGRVVDGGDAGDTYNHAPPRADTLVDTPGRVEVESVCTGPLVSVLEIRRDYAWPSAATPEGRSPVTENVTVTTRAELRAGEPYLRLEMSFDNRCRDHRVRWHAPLPSPAAESFSEGQLSIVRRGLTGEGGCGEEPLPTFPAEGFVTAGGLAVLLDQVTEYELTGGELALTLIRSVGLLSSNRNAYRDEPAGPQLPTPAAQCPGPVTTRLAVLPHPGTWHEAGLPRLAEEYRHALLAVPGSGRAAASPGAGGPGMSPEQAGASLAVEGTGVVLTALRERGDVLEIRVVAEHPTATEAVVRGPFGAARRADVLGVAGERLEVTGGVVRLPLRPFEIATLHLTRAG
ncbi:glycoside hydrolase family 38 C-terminal domain-containing protein [Streptosporangium roseum]|uniref:Alpha-mannosidase-like protein n=1 Tax=Streptosporangium roseum (strain ATCC 12428 / DSM 43021 / JCM 3005 / KCTC 9067 / NCIMB 10171 / NRRL 2505 / NI 9100) TaxID=479432 RepID=D2ATV8_STRRD|nr:glycoside hydrolase family 38 C-terminal domain-containing protein [Streptosporangium roseum]ACZ88613.1 Alpha-mannosidase-like protein [Streptosporangium roseum DSM 43021]